MILFVVQERQSWVTYRSGLSIEVLGYTSWRRTSGPFARLSQALCCGTPGPCWRVKLLVRGDE